MDEIVSVVVPVYNVKKYLKRCLDTVVNQTYKKLDIIVIDDGSTDGSGNLCDEIGSSDDRIRVIHQENKGLSAARNKGIDISKGNYICFVDSDDYLSLDYVNVLLKTALNTNSDIVVCDFERGEADNYTFERQQDGINIETFNSDRALEIWHGKYKDVETISWNKIYKKSIFENGLRYPDGMYFEDVPTIHRQVKEAKRISYISNKLYYYYQRKSSIMHAYSDKKIIHNLHNQEERLKWFEKEKLEAAYVRLLSKCMKYYMVSYLMAEDKKLKNEILSKFKLMLKENKKKFCLKDRIMFCFFKYAYKIILISYNVFN